MDAKVRVGTVRQVCHAWARPGVVRFGRAGVVELGPDRTGKQGLGRGRSGEAGVFRFGVPRRD